MKLYIYEIATLRVVEVVEGKTNADCEMRLLEWDLDTYGATYSPAFGVAGGLNAA